MKCWFGKTLYFLIVFTKAVRVFKINPAVGAASLTKETGTVVMVCGRKCCEIEKDMLVIQKALAVTACMK